MNTAICSKDPVRRTRIKTGTPIPSKLYPFVQVEDKWRLGKLCKEALSLKRRTPFKINISHEMFRVVVGWQLKDKYPNLLFWCDHWKFFVMRVH